VIFDLPALPVPVRLVRRRLDCFRDPDRELLFAVARVSRVDDRFRAPPPLWARRDVWELDCLRDDALAWRRDDGVDRRRDPALRWRCELERFRPDVERFRPDADRLWRPELERRCPRDLSAL
jgi:hypothetical protein